MGRIVPHTHTQIVPHTHTQIVPQTHTQILTPQQFVLYVIVIDINKNSALLRRMNVAVTYVRL